MNHEPKAKGSETHVIPNDRLPGSGCFDVSSDGDGFLEAFVAEVTSSKVGNQPLSVYEKLHPSFRFFVQLTVNVAVDAPRLKTLAQRVFRVTGMALCRGVGSVVEGSSAVANLQQNDEDVFFPQVDPTSLTCVVMENGYELRLVFPDLIVDSTRALRLHRHVIESLHAYLPNEDKRILFSDPPRTEKAFAVLPLDVWKDVSPSGIYIDGMGVAMCGGTTVVRCTAVSKRGKTAHRECTVCNRTGFVPMHRRIEPLTIFANACDPKEDEERFQTLQQDPAAIAKATMLRRHDASELTEPFLIPTYAPLVPMQTNRHGRNELADCFECERSTFGPQPIRASASPRYEYDTKSNDLRVLQTMMATQAVCRKMHPAYSRVTIKKMYKVTCGTKPLVRILVDGQNATFCMGKQRHHSGHNGACRASFTIADVKGRAKIYQECFSTECMSGKRRYCSNEKAVPAQLAEQLGIGTCDGEALDDAMFHECALRLFAQMRDQRVKPLRTMLRTGGGMRHRR